MTMRIGDLARRTGVSAKTIRYELGGHTGPRRFYRAQGFVLEPLIFGFQGAKVVFDPLACIPPHG